MSDGLISDVESTLYSLMELLFSFELGMRIEKTLMKTLMQTLASQLSYNSCSR